MMGLRTAWMGLMSSAAGSLLKTVLCAVTTRLAVSLRAGYVMGTQTVLTKEMNKDVVGFKGLPESISNCITVDAASS